MAERTDCSASSARIMSAGGAWRPMRCRAASTSAITSRRSSSDLRSASSLSSSGLRRSWVWAMRSSTLDDARGGIDQLLVELAPVVADRFDLALELGLVLQRPALLGAERFEFLVALPSGCRHWRPAASGGTGGRGGGAAQPRRRRGRAAASCPAPRRGTGLEQRREKWSVIVRIRHPFVCKNGCQRRKVNQDSVHDIKTKR